MEYKSISPFRKNFFSIFQAGIFVQLLSILILPILSRLYSPIQFGTLALFTSLISLILSFATLRFEWLVPNAKTKVEAAGLILLGVISLIFFAIILQIIWVKNSEILVNLISKNENSDITLDGLNFLINLAIFGGGFLALLKSWYVFLNDLTFVGKSMLIQSTSKSLLSAFLGFFSLSRNGLITSYIAGLWAGCAVLAKDSKGLWTSIDKISKQKIEDLFLRFKKEAFISTLVSLVNLVSLSLPLFLISYRYSIKEAGWYSLMFSVAAAPIGLFTSSLSESYWAHAANLYKSGLYRELNRNFKKTTLRLTWGIPPILILCCLGPLIVGPIFGKEEWSEAGLLLLVMAPMFIGNLVFSPTNHLVVLKRQSLQLFADLIRIILISFAIISSSYMSWNVYFAIMLSSIASLIGHSVLFIIHIYEHKKLIK